MSSPYDGNDAEFIKHPDYWPAWPFLPIRRRKIGDCGLENECALLIATSQPWHSVYLCNLFALPDNIAELNGMRGPSYDSVEALLADGWQVD